MKYDKICLGKVEGEKIYLSPPSWDCEWYWGFGYLGNSSCHYHLDGLSNDKNLFDALQEHFGNTFLIKENEDIWTFCELVQTFYSLKETAEVLRRGGSHYTNNPLKKIITDKKKVDEINNKILPLLFDEIYKILNKYDK